MKRRRSVIASLVALGAFTGLIVFDAIAPADAGEMRTLRRIFSPHKGLSGGAITAPGDITDFTGIPKNIDRTVVDKAVRDMAAKWNTPAFSGILSPTFAGLGRLQDSLSQLPNNARMEVVRINGLQPISRNITKRDDAGTKVMVRDRVAVEVEIRVTYTNTGGLKTVDGTNEFIIDINQGYSR
ncbi:hypothetical protein [Magnetospira sp. QH-2]|uniref:hypothetical protein n=1 Tax=Magnetospira sp. (strain QH-2) TaxID=1288970 RepID=UPI0003E8156B|nr:hypothetical protein [Magnetospira sp. QH-2]CCQ74895.1 exported protein of unknown function [Magnetospira sp. QH-2]